LTRSVLWVFLFGLAIIALWTLLPFAVFGVKSRLDDLIAESRRTNNQLTRLIDAVNESRDPTK